jgi:nucleotide-binding universal stress UspA family protein
VLPVAEQWAQALGVPLHLVNVIPPGGSRGPTDIPPDVIEGGYLERLAQTVHGAGATGYEVLYGDPARAVADYSRRSAALIAVATHGRDGFDRVLGSTAMAIVHRSRRPVLVVRPRREHEDGDG